MRCGSRCASTSESGGAERRRGACVQVVTRLAALVRARCACCRAIFIVAAVGYLIAVSVAASVRTQRAPRASPHAADALGTTRASPARRSSSSLPWAPSRTPPTSFEVVAQHCKKLRIEQCVCVQPGGACGVPPPERWRRGQAHRSAPPPASSHLSRCAKQALLCVAAAPPSKRAVALIKCARRTRPHTRGLRAGRSTKSGTRLSARDAARDGRGSSGGGGCPRLRCGADDDARGGAAGDALPGAQHAAARQHRGVCVGNLRPPDR